MVFLCYVSALQTSGAADVWGEDKEGIPPAAIKKGPTLVNVTLSCPQSFSDPQETAGEMDSQHTKEPRTA